jgi:EAL domain-containing protein (putative c-di-GMP-specific phosphodiesterase class I)
MPLTDLVRLLNARSDSLYPGDHLANPFVATEHGVVVHFADLRLHSHFLPIVDTASGQLHGHAAALRVTGLSSRKEVDPAAVFVLPSNDREFVHLDRLVRTLHALNYLTQRVRGNLLLKVHQRHVLSVPSDHGLAFEELLRECGLLPTQVTLEIDTENVEGIEDTNHLQRAIANYKSRGYGIAIARFGHASIDFGLLEGIRPDIVKLAPALLGSARPLQRLIGRLQGLGAKVLIEGVETGAMRKGAAANGIDLIQSIGTLERLRSGAPKGAPLTPAAENFAAPLEFSAAWAVG